MGQLELNHRQKPTIATCRILAEENWTRVRGEHGVAREAIAIGGENSVGIRRLRAESKILKAIFRAEVGSAGDSIPELDEGRMGCPARPARLVDFRALEAVTRVQPQPLREPNFGRYLPPTVHDWRERACHPEPRQGRGIRYAPEVELAVQLKGAAEFLIESEGGAMVQIGRMRAVTK